MNRKLALLCMFAVALPAYMLLWPEAPVTEGDSPQYLAVARDLTDFRLDEVHDRTPGYPALLVLTGSADTPGKGLFVASLLLHFVSVWLLAGALRTSGLSTRATLAVAGLMLLPPYVEPAAHVMTENLAQFTLVLTVATLVAWARDRRPWFLVVAGLALAAATFTRPIYQLLAPALAVCVLLVAAARRSSWMTIRQAVRGSAVVLAVSTLAIAAYAYGNRVKFGFFGVTSTVGFHLSTKTMSFVERLPEEYAEVREVFVRERDAQLTQRGGPHTGTQTVWSVRDQLSAITGLDRPALSRYLLRMNLVLIARAPIEYLNEVARSLAGYWFPAAGRLASLNSRALRWSWAIVHAVLFASFALQLVMFAGVILFSVSRGLAARRRDILASVPLKASDLQAMTYVLAVSIVFYNMVLTCMIDIGETRQRRPTELLFVFACVLGVQLWRQSVASAPAGASGEPAGSPTHDVSRVRA